MELKGAGNGYPIAEEGFQGEAHSEHRLHIKKGSRELQENIDTICRQLVNLLTYSHYRKILRNGDKTACDWYEYEKEAWEQIWKFFAPQYNTFQHHYCMPQKQKNGFVNQGMLKIDDSFQDDKQENIRDSVMAEFMGLAFYSEITESSFENSLLTKLQIFFMKLGKGYAFVARQQHIHVEEQDCFIDLVFYNYILKCFVLVDLEAKRITHQDVLRMNSCIYLFDKLKRNEGDNPTIGILLCANTDEDIVKYFVPYDNEQIFASEYKPYLPMEEEIRVEIETHTAMFYLHQNEKTYKKE